MADRGGRGRGRGSFQQQGFPSRGRGDSGREGGRGGFSSDRGRGERGRGGFRGRGALAGPPALFRSVSKREERPSD